MMALLWLSISASPEAWYILEGYMDETWSFAISENFKTVSSMRFVGLEERSNRCDL